jgi:hypothetical protein
VTMKLGRTKSGSENISHAAVRPAKGTEVNDL